MPNKVVWQKTLPHRMIFHTMKFSYFRLKKPTHSMLVSTTLKLFFVFECLVQTTNGYEAFSQEDEAAYLDAFSTLIKDSYSASLPQDLIAACKNQPRTTTTTIKSMTTSMLSSDLQLFCGSDSICTIPTGFTVTMNSNLNVAALILNGSLIWNDISQSSNDQWLCAGYIAVRFDFNGKIKKNEYLFCLRSMEANSI